MSQLIWYSRICNSYQDFLHRSVLLTRKLLIETRLRSTLKKCFGRYHHLALPYRVSVTTMTNDICRRSNCCHEYPWFDIADIMMGAGYGAENAYPSGKHHFTSDFHGGSCYPVICDSLFHVIVLSFGFSELIVPFFGCLAYLYFLLLII